MQIIAHRVFEDCAGFETLQPARLSECQGAEIDIRLDEHGAPVVRHAPIFGGRLRRGDPRKPLEAALERLEEIPTLRTVMIDAKSAAAAATAARAVAGRAMRLDPVFLCWGPRSARAVRSVAPKARVLFGLAPIFTRRAPRPGRDELRLCNAFPFLERREKRRREAEADLRHAIAIKLIARNAGGLRLPRGVDGLCIHRIFLSDRLAALAAARELDLAVYGLSAPARAQSLPEGVAFGIASLRKSRRDPLPATPLEDRLRAA